MKICDDFDNDANNRSIIIQSYYGKNNNYLNVKDNRITGEVLYIDN